MLLVPLQPDAAIQKVADMRATFGSQLNRLDHNLNNVNSQATNMAASASQIEDADMAKEMSEMTKFKILNEAGISMLSQATKLHKWFLNYYNKPFVLVSE